MYRHMTVAQLQTTKTEFIKHLSFQLKREQIPSLKQYLRHQRKQGSDIYYFFRGSPQFRIQKQADDIVCLTDEKERIQIHVSPKELNILHGMTMKYLTRKKLWSGQALTMAEQLEQSISEGKRNTINGKDYLVYDIETTYATRDLTKTEFILAYAYVMTGGNGTYKYIDTTNLEQFVQFLLDFDGYIIGFNNFSFDNPVTVYNVPWRQQSWIDQINAKSLDLFTFVAHTTGKKIGLNKIATAFADTSKTLESWAEWDKLMKLYEETGDEKYLKKFKNYCKNDVKMTLLVMVYMLTYKTLRIDDTIYEYDEERFLELASKPLWKTKNNKDRQIFAEK